MAIIIKARARPALPTTYPSLRKRMIPSIVRILGVKTPPKVPRVPSLDPEPPLCLPASAIKLLSAAHDREGSCMLRTWHGIETNHCT